MGEPALMVSMLQQYSPVRNSIKFSLLMLAFVLGVLAAMGLRKPGGNDGITREGVDLVFALDLSGSMLAADVAPNRLERAKELISQIISSMPNNRVGLVWFAGKAYVQMPISNDHGAAKMFLHDASPDNIPIKGTVISSALEESLRLFGDHEAKYKALVLITDGEDHDKKAVQISKELSHRGLMVNTVGIGSPQGSFIPDSAGFHKTDNETGQEIVSKLNEELLQQIAANTNGVYIHLTNVKDAVDKVNRQLSQIKTKVSGDMNLMSFTHYFWIFAALMLLCLMAEQILPLGKKEPIS